MKALTGKNILITRPAGQSENLARMVREQGGNPIIFPSIEILPLENHTELARILARLADHDLAIFVSANAVTHSLPHLLAAWPKNVAVAAMGEGTAKALKAFGIVQVIVPKAGADSESLLESVELKKVRGKRVLIFRGQGGREQLKRTLVERGAMVAYAECYRRGIPKRDPAPLIELWSKSQLHAIIATSSEGLRNLFAMLPQPGDLRNTPLFVPHPRIAATAHELKFVRTMPTRPGDSGLIAGLIEWFGTRI